MRFVSMLSFLKTSFLRGRRRPRHPGAPRLEELEGRALPSVFLVHNEADAGPGSLRRAVLDANAEAGHDRILILPQVNGPIVLTSGPLRITDDLTILGTGADGATISGNRASRVFEIARDVTAEFFALTIADGRATQGAGILNGGSLTLFRSVVAGNQALNNAGDGRGGGIFNEAGATVVLSHSEVVGNRAFGVPLPGTSSALQPGGKGGGLYNEGTASVLHSTFARNQAVGAGGEFFFGGRGGAIWNGFALPPTSPAATLVVFQSEIVDNAALGEAGVGVIGGRALGGGIYNRIGETTVLQSTLHGNRAIAGPSGGAASGNFGGGGAMANTRSAGGPRSTVTIDHSTISDNRTVGGPGTTGNNGQGGVMYNEGDVSISHSVLSGNRATGGDSTLGAAADGYGGVLRNIGVGDGLPVRVTISHSVLAGNQAVGGTARGAGGLGGDAFGGAIANGADHVLEIVHSTLSDNEALGSPGAPGGLGGTGLGGAVSFGGASFTLVASTVTGNRAVGGAGGDGRNGGSGQGGGLNLSAGTITIEESVITANEAIGGPPGAGGPMAGPGIGGGVYISGGAAVTIRDTSIAGNHATTSNDDVFGTFSDGELFPSIAEEEATEAQPRPRTGLSSDTPEADDPWARLPD